MLFGSLNQKYSVSLDNTTYLIVLGLIFWFQIPFQKANYNCMRVVKTCNQFYIGYQSKGIYVIVDKLHKNDLKAMREVFDIDVEKAEELQHGTESVYKSVRKKH